MKYVQYPNEYTPSRMHSIFLINVANHPHEDNSYDGG